MGVGLQRARGDDSAMSAFAEGFARTSSAASSAQGFARTRSAASPADGFSRTRSAGSTRRGSIASTGMERFAEDHAPVWEAPVETSLEKVQVGIIFGECCTSELVARAYRGD